MDSDVQHETDAHGVRNLSYISDFKLQRAIKKRDKLIKKYSGMKQSSWPYDITKYIYDIQFNANLIRIPIYNLAHTLPENSNILEIGSHIGSTTCTLKEAKQNSIILCRHMTK